MKSDPTQLAAIRRHLLRRHRLLGGGIAVLLLIGLPMLLIGPLVLSCIFWFATWSLWGYVPWSWFFWGFVIGLIPLLFWTEIRTRGSFLADTVVEAGGASPLPYLAGPEIGMLISFATSPRVTVSGFVEIFLTGPRFVLDAFRKLAQSKRLKHANLDRAAEIVMTLQRFERGIPLDQLLRPNERVSDILMELAYLLFHDWIGISKTGDRVWLPSDAKCTLETSATL